jgi:hypothetical protein
MGDDLILIRPGKSDINDQFKAGKRIRKTKRIFDAISRGGDYKFGELTAFFYGYDVDEDAAWQDDIKNNYTDMDAKIVEEIKQNVITVLSKVDPHNPNTRISLTFEWYPANPMGVTMTSDAAGEAYTMKISGFREPARSFAESRKPKSD